MKLVQYGHMSMENIGGASRRGPSEASRQNAIEAISTLTQQYQQVKLNIERVREEPESVEKDEELTTLYGKQRILRDRLEAMGAKPDTIQ